MDFDMARNGEVPGIWRRLNHKIVILPFKLQKGNACLQLSNEIYDTKANEWHRKHRARLAIIQYTAALVRMENIGYEPPATITGSHLGRRGTTITSGFAAR